MARTLVFGCVAFFALLFVDLRPAEAG